jgi:peptide/nickel transport system substrate-binding protein
MTDFKELDPLRREANASQLDLVESFAQGKINRRHFIQRGTVLGLSLASISAIIAACGGSSDSGGGGGATDTGIGEGEVATTAAAKIGGTIKLAMSLPGSEGVNPITMIDLVTYNVCAQVFEYLVRSSSDLSIQPQLATEWSGSADGTEWTFKLREGVMWQDGTPFTSADVVATMDKLVEAGNSALTGTLSKGGTTAPDDLTIVMKLDKPNGHFPYLVSSDNTQSLITPVAWTVKDNLEPGKGGTGPWKLDSLDVKTGATYSRNESWWGGKTPLDKVDHGRSGCCAPERPEHEHRRAQVRCASPALDALRQGCRHGSEGPPGDRLDDGPPEDRRQGPRWAWHGRQRPGHLRAVPVLRQRRCRAAHAGHRQGQGPAVRGRC